MEFSIACVLLVGFVYLILLLVIIVKVSVKHRFLINPIFMGNLMVFYHIFSNKAFCDIFLGISLRRSFYSKFPWFNGEEIIIERWIFQKCIFLKMVTKNNYSELKINYCNDP